MASANRLRRLLNGGTVVAILIVVAALAWAAGDVAELPQPSTPRRLVASAEARSEDADPNDNRFSMIWTRALQGRRQAVAAKPAVPSVTLSKDTIKPSKRAVASDQLRLVGTIVEAGQSVVIASDRQGRLTFGREGQPLPTKPKPAWIDSIEVDGVWIRRKGQRVRVDVGDAIDVNSMIRPTPETREIQANDSATSTVNVPGAVVMPADVQDDAVPEMSLEDELEWLNGG